MYIAGLNLIKWGLTVWARYLPKYPLHVSELHLEKKVTVGCMGGPGGGLNWRLMVKISTKF